MGRFRTTIPRSRVPWHRRLRQDPAALRYWLLVATAAVVLGGVVGHARATAVQAQADWGRSHLVWVATADVAPGDRLDGAVRAERWPTGLVPPAALRRAPSGGRAAAPIARGVPLTAGDVAGADRSSRRRSVALPLGDGHLPVDAGDRVQVWATVDPSLVADGEVATHLLAPSALVDRTGDGWVVVRVEPAEVRALADAAASATITLVGTS